MAYFIKPFHPDISPFSHLFVSIYIYSHLCIYLYLFVCIYLTIFISLSLSLSPHKCLSIYLSIYLSIFINIYLFRNIYLSIYILTHDMPSLPLPILDYSLFFLAFLDSHIILRYNQSLFLFAKYWLFFATIMRPRNRLRALNSKSAPINNAAGKARGHYSGRGAYRLTTRQNVSGGRREKFAFRNEQKYPVIAEGVRVMRGYRAAKLVLVRAKQLLVSIYLSIYPQDQSGCENNIN
ncbi:unnamed protein product [Acanthosepion pharaonis]|uniref:Uncharacterized protein n=1 Tax=Acanthosepion pharaonis TaxID=158019 RepID=A0A812CBZ2_ACAPH|nr:unnamed protein product [Sepia pharaonis]